jgi:putative hydrolase of the HAD superfamily
MKLAIFDFNRTIYDPENSTLILGARQVLQSLQTSGVELVLVSKREAGRAEILENLGIRDLFTEVIFTNEKTARLFTEIIARCGHTPETTYVIGDHPYGEIREGNRAGARTIRFKQGKFATLKPEHADDEPWRTISDLSECIPIIV